MLVLLLPITTIRKVNRAVIMEIITVIMEIITVIMEITTLIALL
jgi:hypothetical protein